MTNRTKATFQFLAAAGGSLGLLRTFPAYAAVHANVGIAAVLALLPGILMLGLLWYVIRRRDLSTRSAAVHLVVALWIGWTLAGILTHPVAQVVAPELTWRIFAMIAIGGGLFVAPVLMLVAALLIRIGRLLPGSGTRVEPRGTGMSAPAT